MTEIFTGFYIRKVDRGYGLFQVLTDKSFHIHAELQLLAVVHDRKVLDVLISALSRDFPSAAILKDL